MQDSEYDNEDATEDLTEVHEGALKRYSDASAQWSEIFTDYINDVRFSRLGVQWDEETLRERTEAGEISLTYNILDTHINYVVNQMKSSKPSIKITPKKNANKEEAQIIDGIIRSILANSDADDAFSNAYQDAVAGGIGMFRIVPEYDEDGTVEFCIERILNPLQVIIDPSAKKSDFSDAEYCFIISSMSKEKFKEKFPDKECSDFTSTNEWYTKDSVQVAEYWVKEDGKVSQYIMNGTEILKANTDYLGKYIPVCLVVGQEVNVDGQRKFKSLIRESKDIQKFMNYSKSKSAWMLSHMNKAQYVVPTKAFNGNESRKRQFEGGITGKLDVITYDGDTPPGLLVQPPINPAILNAANDAANDIKLQTGLMNPYEDIPPMVSGKAMSLQIAEKNVQTYGYLDNLYKAQKYCGKILVDLIQKYMVEPQEIALKQASGQIEYKKINQMYQKPDGSWKNHKLSEGKYTVDVSTAPSYESQRQETVDKLLELSARSPKMADILGDIIVGAMDFEASDIAADRLRALLPPNLQSIGVENGSPEQSKMAAMQMQQQMMEMKNIMDQMAAKIQEQGQIISQKENGEALEMQKFQMQLQADMAKNQSDNTTKIEIEKMKNVSSHVKTNKDNETKLELQARDNMASYNKEIVKKL